MFIIIYLILGWMAVSHFQRCSSMVFFTSLDKYIFNKILIALFLGWILIPIWIVMLLLGK